MVKKTLFVVLLVMPTLLFAQQFGEDIVTLRNGSVIRGVIIEQTPNESLRLQTRDGNIFVFRFDEIQTIGRDMSGQRNQRGGNQREVSAFNRPRGYFGEVVLGAGINSWDGSNFSVSVINGFRVFPQFAVGLGVRVESFSYNDWRWWDYSGGIRSGVSVPVFLHLRSDFLNRRASPFVVTNIGAETYWGGAFAEFILGCSFNIGQRNRLSVGLGSRVTDGPISINLTTGFSW